MRVELQTDDNVTIIGEFVGEGKKRAAILLHMMPSDRNSWKLFANKLNGNGFASLAIDERGHGESTMNGTLNFRSFTDTQQQKKILDVKAVFDYLLKLGFKESDIIIVGASIGANLAIQFSTIHHQVPFAIALSPGIDYHGIQTDDFIARLGNNQKVILIASSEDNYSFSSIKRLNLIGKEKTILLERTGIGHGTDMLENDKKLSDEIIALISL